jgi:hypothetical protein
MYVFLMAIKYSNIFYFKPSKIYPIWDFWFENIPSGNPATEFNVGIFQIEGGTTEAE